MTGDLSEPVDRTHRESLAAIDQIRQWVAWRRRQVARWEPRPYTIRVGRR